MKPLRLVRPIVLAWGLLLAQQAGLLHVFSHLPKLRAVVTQSEVRPQEPAPVEGAEQACSLCTAFGGSHGAPPALLTQVFTPSDALFVAPFAVSPAPTFSHWPAFTPRAPPELPV